MPDWAITILTTILAKIELIILGIIYVYKQKSKKQLCIDKQESDTKQLTTLMKERKELELELIKETKDMDIEKLKLIKEITDSKVKELTELMVELKNDNYKHIIGEKVEDKKQH